MASQAAFSWLGDLAILYDASHWLSSVREASEKVSRGWDFMTRESMIGPNRRGQISWRYLIVPMLRSSGGSCSPGSTPGFSPAEQLEASSFNVTRKRAGNSHRQETNGGTTCCRGAPDLLYHRHQETSRERKPRIQTSGLTLTLWSSEVITETL